MSVVGSLDSVFPQDRLTSLLKSMVLTLNFYGLRIVYAPHAS
jgi:hypothetical protein